MSQQTPEPDAPEGGAPLNDTEPDDAAVQIASSELPEDDRDEEGDPHEDGA